MSLGATLLLHRHFSGHNPAHPRFHHAYWAPLIPLAQTEQALATAQLPAESLSEADLLQRVVGHLCTGRTVGWAQGRAEVG